MKWEDKFRFKQLNKRSGINEIVWEKYCLLFDFQYLRFGDFQTIVEVVKRVKRGCWYIQTLEISQTADRKAANNLLKRSSLVLEFHGRDFVGRNQTCLPGRPPGLPRSSPSSWWQSTSAWPSQHPTSRVSVNAENGPKSTPSLDLMN